MLQSIITFLGVIAEIIKIRDPDSHVDEYVRLAALLANEGEDARDELQALNNEVAEMVAASVGPTPERLAEVRARRKALSDRIQSVDLSDQPEGQQ
jgi:hypothetical protein